MKRILVVSFVLLISIMAFAVPAFATEVDDPVSLEAQGLSVKDIPKDYAILRVKSHLGDLELVIPPDVPSDAFVLDGEYLRNLTDSTVYFYCIQFPEYTFSAQRYGVLAYRVNNAGVNQTVDLIVEEFEATPSLEEAFPYVFLVIFLVSMFGTLWDFGRRV